MNIIDLMANQIFWCKDSINFDSDLNWVIGPGLFISSSIILGLSSYSRSIKINRDKLIDKNHKNIDNLLDLDKQQIINKIENNIPNSLNNSIPINFRVKDQRFIGKINSYESMELDESINLENIKLANIDTTNIKYDFINLQSGQTSQSNETNETGEIEKNKKIESKGSDKSKKSEESEVSEESKKLEESTEESEESEVSEESKKLEESEESEESKKLEESTEESEESKKLEESTEESEESEESTDEKLIKKYLRAIKMKTPSEIEYEESNSNELIIKLIVPKIIWDFENEFIKVLKSTRNKNLNILIETSGGKIPSIHNICNALYIYKKLNPKNTIKTYVNSFAYSGGTIIALMGDQLYMDDYAFLSMVDTQLHLDQEIHSVNDIKNLNCNTDENPNNPNNPINPSLLVKLATRYDNLIKKIFEKFLFHGKKYNKKQKNTIINRLNYSDTPHIESLDKEDLNEIGIVISGNIPIEIKKIFDEIEIED